jgi:hypothetical protein
MSTTTTQADRILESVTALPGRTHGFYADHLELREDAVRATLVGLRNAGKVTPFVGPVAGVTLWRPVA